MSRKFLAVLLSVCLLASFASGVTVMGADPTDDSIAVFNDFESANAAEQISAGANATVALETEKVYQGDHAVKLTTTGEGNWPWETNRCLNVLPQDGELFDPAGYDYLVFYYADTAETAADADALAGAATVRVYVYDEDGTWYGSEWVGQGLQADGKWNKVIVPMATLKLPEGKKISKLVLGEWNSRDYYFDNIYFAKDDGVAVGSLPYNDFESDSAADTLQPGADLNGSIAEDPLAEEAAGQVAKIEKTADGTDHPQASLDVLPAEGTSVDATGYGYIRFRLLDTQGDNSLAFFVFDSEGNRQSNFTDSIAAEGCTGKGVKNEWTTVVIDLSKFDAYDPADVARIGFAEWNRGTYYIDDIEFVTSPYSTYEQLENKLAEAKELLAQGQMYWTEESFQAFSRHVNWLLGDKVMSDIHDYMMEEAQATVLADLTAVMEGLTVDPKYQFTDYTTGSEYGGSYGFAASTDAVMRYQTFYAHATGTLEFVDVMLKSVNVEDQSDLVAYLCTVEEDGFTPKEQIATATVSKDSIPTNETVITIPMTAQVTKGTAYALVLTQAEHNKDAYSWTTYKGVTDPNGELYFNKIQSTELIGGPIQDESGLGVGYLKAYIAAEGGEEPEPEPEPEPDPLPELATEDTIYNDFEDSSAEDAVAAGEGMTVTVSDEDVHAGSYAVKLEKTAEGTDPQYALNILPPSGKSSFDASHYRYLTFWVKDTQGANSLALFITDATGKSQSGWTDALSVAGFSGNAVNNEWHRMVIDLNKFGEVDLSQVASIGFAEWNKGTYYIDDIAFVVTPYTIKEQLLNLFEEAGKIYEKGQLYWTTSSWNDFTGVYELGETYLPYLDLVGDDILQQVLDIGNEAMNGLTVDRQFAVTDYGYSWKRAGGYGFSASSDAVMRSQTFYAAATGTVQYVEVMISANGEPEDGSDLVAYLYSLEEDGITPKEQLATATVSRDSIPTEETVITIPMTAQVTQGEKYIVLLTQETPDTDAYSWITYRYVSDANGSLEFLKFKGTDPTTCEIQDESNLGVGYLKVYIEQESVPEPTYKSEWYNNFESANVNVQVGSEATGDLTSDEAYEGSKSFNLNVATSGWPNNATRIVWVLPDGADSFDASEYNYLIFWVKDTQGANGMDVYFQDVNGGAKNGWTSDSAVKGEWTKFVIDVSSYHSEMDMSQLLGIGFSEYNEGAYYIDAIYFANDPDAPMPEGGEPTPTYEPGDVNQDGLVNSSDARMILQATVGYVELTSKQEELADVNEDGLVNSRDARWVLQQAVSEP